MGIVGKGVLSREAFRTRYQFSSKLLISCPTATTIIPSRDFPHVLRGIPAKFLLYILYFPVAITLY